MQKKLHIPSQVSCSSARVYLTKYEEFILKQGYDLTPDPSQADVILIDTCGANLDKEDQSIDLIRKSQASAKPDVQIIVSGCLAGINPKRIEENFNGQYFSPKNEKQLALILGVDPEEAKFLNPLEVRGGFMGGDSYTGSSPFFRFALKSLTTAHQINNTIPLTNVPLIGKFLDCTQGANSKAYAITISQGCLGNCSFCVIPQAKGKTQSIPMVAIIEKIKEVVNQGVKKIILTSEDTGAYGKDIGTTFVDLLRRIHEIDGDFSIHIHFFDPRWLRPYGKELLEILAKGKVRYLQAPIQSGSNAMLGQMRRVYQVEQVLPYIQEFRKKLPNLALSTQIIAGFPGETEEDFQLTRNLLRLNLFHWVQIFDYSERPGAATEKIPNHHSMDTIKKRAAILSRDWKLARFKIYPFLGLRAKTWNWAPSGS